MTSKGAPKRRKVEQIEDWDNARYAITPPRAALDLRLTLIHFRLMSMLGRVNTQQGWCEMSQTAFAEALGYARGSVVRAVKELVEWGYVEKRGQEASGSARCHYRLLIDEAEEPDDDATCNVEGDTPTCNVAGDTGVTSHESDVSRTWDTIEERSKIKDHSPSPSADGARGEGRSIDDGEREVGTPEAEQILAELARAGVDPPVINLLLRPVLTRRRFSNGDRVATLLGLGKRARGLEPEALKRAARDVLDAGVMTIKAERFGKAVDDAIRAGARVVIKPSTPQWDRWMDHLDQVDPAMAALARKIGTCQVRTEWPPAGGSAS